MLERRDTAASLVRQAIVADIRSPSGEQRAGPRHAPGWPFAV